MSLSNNCNPNEFHNICGNVKPNNGQTLKIMEMLNCWFLFIFLLLTYQISITLFRFFLLLFLQEICILMLFHYAQLG